MLSPPVCEHLSCNPATHSSHGGQLASLCLKYGNCGVVGKIPITGQTGLGVNIHLAITLMFLR